MSDDSEQLDAAIAEYIQLVEAGNAPDARSFLERHGDVRGALESFLADYGQMRAATGSGPSAPPSVNASRNTASLSAEDTPRSRLIDGAPAPIAPVTVADTSAVDPSPPRPLELPRQFGDYELLELIAQGGMGVVYKARQCRLGRTVAIKMILAGQLASDEEVQRFFREARAAGGLDHPAIVPVYEVGRCDGQHFFSMGFVDGGSLADEVRDGPVDQQRAVRHVLAISEAVAYAHEHGVIHRDIKPGNVLIDKDGKLRITDFGLAARTAETVGATVTGTILGTPAYMPPEQASGLIENVGPLSDVYSIGAVLYCLLTGRPPFQAPHPVETLRQVIDQEPVPPRQLNVAISADVETICLKCLEKDASQRYGSARELAEDLTRYLNHHPILARPVSRLTRTAKLVRRHRVVSVLVAVVAVSLLLSAGISTWFAVEADVRADAEFQARQELGIKEAEASRLAAEKSDLVEQQSATITRLEDNLYVSRLREAQAAVEAGNYETARALLDAALPTDGGRDRRCFVWRYLRHQLRHVTPEFHDVSGDFYMMTQGRIVVAPGGNRFAVAFRETIWLGEFSTGELTRSITVSGKPITDVGFSNDSRYLAVALGEASGNTRIKNLSLSHGGVEIYDLHDPGSVPMEIRMHSSDIADPANQQDRYGICVAFSPTQNVLACGLSQGRIALYDCEKHRHIAALTPPDVVDGSTKDCERLQFTPDGRQIISVRFAHAVDVWDVATGQHVKELHRYQTRVPFRSQFYRNAFWQPDPAAIAMTPDGAIVAVAANGLHFDLFHLPSGQRTEMLGHGDAITSLAFLPDGETLASGSLDHDIRLWNAQSGVELARLGSHRDAVHGIGVHPNGRKIITAGADNRLLTWNLPAPDDPPSVLHTGNHVYDLVFRPNSNRLAAGGWPTTGTTNEWDTITGERFPMKQQQTGRVGELDVSANGDLLVTANLEGQAIDVWNRDGEHVRRIDAGTIITRVSAHPDGRLAAMGSPAPPTIFIVDLQTGNLIKQIEADQIVYSPAGNVYAEIDDGRLRMREVETDREIPMECPQNVARPTFSPDGRLLGLQYGLTAIVVVDVEQRRVLFEADGHYSLVTDLAFAPDGKTVASVAHDARILLWDITTGRLKAELTGHTASIEAVVFDAEGTTLATAGIDGTIRLWRAPDSGDSSDRASADTQAKVRMVLRGNSR